MGGSLEALRRKRSLTRIHHSDSSIFNYIYEAGAFKLPTWLQVPPELQDSHDKLHKAAIGALAGMHSLMTLREQRYSAMCPETMGLIYHVHANSMKRLLEWKEDWNPANCTLAPSPKIPRDSIKFCVDALSYSGFTTKYVNAVQEFIRGPYRLYCEKKTQIEYLAARLMSHDSYYMEWRRWWESTFAVEMCKWEGCIEGLVIPTWEEMIDEVSLLIVDRVEDADELASSFYVSSPNSVSPL
ncbi:hypothetical protein N7510_008379 [Penicillium lagena]|uniref:uncharacterized protein n=1 Tax=Penicillium lagena TaxID=94218 RepID=UPI00253FE10B|nr:uncharacterized protein N7510_008379 [Penicillium lagena]KAJ5605598.1 hypothetical protein N7510_008379 [Penicillium lagena]